MSPAATTEASRWSAARAADWYARQPWIVGSNFVPSTAANQLEMWQAATFDPETLGRELRWAAGLGLNAVRVYLHDLLWDDAEGFRGRVDRFLELASRAGIRTLLVLFDDCWNPDPRRGPQPEPVPGRHNSRWLQSPGDAAIDAASQERLEAYVTGVVRAWGADERVLGFDLYNEPTNRFARPLPPSLPGRLLFLARAARERRMRRARHLALVDRSFDWARAARPEHPLTSGVWIRDPRLNALLLGRSDVVSFHHYGGPRDLRRWIRRLRRHGRPLLCTEYMARPRGSRFATHVPIFREEGVGCFHWGLVRGRTQTHRSWTSRDGSPEPRVWFHDVLHPDGTPWDPEEAALLRRLTGAERRVR